MAETAPRKYNIELLRITSMLSVIMMHFLGVGGVMAEATGGWFVAISIFYSFAIVATSCYVFIGGYFLATSRWKTARIFRLLLEFFTYTFGIYLLFALLVYLKNGDNLLNWHEFGTYYLFPVVHEENWFVTCYLLMVLFAPFVNVLLQNLSQRQHKALIGLLLFLFCLLPSLIWNVSWQFLQNNGYSFVWFLTLYVVAAYFRYYGFPRTLKPSVLVFLYAAASGMTALLVNHEHLYPGFLTEQKNGYYYFFNYNFLTTFVASLCFFALFFHVRIRSDKVGKVINKLASYSFAVFLLHTHPAITGALWHGVVHTEKFINSPWLLLALPLSALAIYAVSSLIEQLRLWLSAPLLKSKRLNARFSEWDRNIGFS